MPPILRAQMGTPAQPLSQAAGPQAVTTKETPKQDICATPSAPKGSRKRKAVDDVQSETPEKPRPKIILNLRKKRTDETPARPAKKAKQVPVPSTDDEPAVDEDEEEPGDEKTWDPEDEDLKALEEEEDYKPAEESKEESEEESDPATGTRRRGKAEPATKLAGQRRARRAKISLECDPSAFEAINIGKTGPLPVKSEEDEQSALQNFEKMMKGIIKFRHELAQQPGTDAMTIRVKHWWNRHKQHDIWLKWSKAITRERQLVIGGIPLGIYKFTDLPAPSSEELRTKWLVYADEIDGKWIYGGSATAAKKHGYGFSRIGGYEKAKRRATAGESIDSDLSGAHMRKALAPGAKMQLRVIGVFDPMHALASDALMLEGCMVDLLGALDTNLDEETEFQTWAAIKAGKAASPAGMPAWYGLNRASPFMQGMRVDSFVARCVAEQDWKCPGCDHRCDDKDLIRRWKRNTLVSWIALDAYICDPCYRALLRQPGAPQSLQELRQRRTMAMGSGKAIANRTSATQRCLGLSLDDAKEAFDAQDHACPVCQSFEGEFGDEKLQLIPYYLKQLFPEAICVCRSCVAWCQHHKARSSPDITMNDILRRRAELNDPAIASSRSLANLIRPEVAQGRQQKFDCLRAQNWKCWICPEQFEEVSVEKITGSANLKTYKGQAHVICDPCRQWWGKLRKAQTLKDAKIDERRRETAAKRAGSS